LNNEVVFRTGDIITLTLYLVGTVGLGVWCAKRARSTEGYFLGSRSIPGWAIGISMLGTAISSVTFLAYPGSAYSGNWSRLVQGLMLPFAAVIGVTYFVTFYRRLRVTSAYEYLEDRFGPWGRSYGCLLFSSMSAYRMGVILYLLSLPLKAMTGWQVEYIIVVTGVLVTFYTVLGGLEAVIWTDVAQTIMLLVGGVMCITLVFLRVPGGAPVVLENAWAADKFSLAVSMDFSFVKDTFWVLALSGIIGNIQEFATDQTKIQRYCAAKSDGAARRAVWIVGLGCIPVWSLFMFVGTCLFVFYKFYPEALGAGLKADEVYPFFILTQMPSGLGGLVIAAALAAAMSSIDSSMNGTATVLTMDIYKRHLVRDKDDHHYLNVGRMLSALAGLFMIIAALLLAQVKDEAILDTCFKVGAVFGGGLGGLFILGFVSKRANSKGAAIGLVTALVLIVWLTVSQLVGGFTYVEQAGMDVVSISPAYGTVEGGTRVTIEGTRFADDATVTIGGNITTIESRSGAGGPMSEIVAVTPSGLPGGTDVVVTNPGAASARLTGGFMYVDAGEVRLVSISPTYGPAEGGTKVTIEGTWFAPDATVTIGGNVATVESRSGAGGPMSEIVAVTPAGTPNGADVVVTNPGAGSARMRKGFTYIRKGQLQVVSISPTSGPVEGGTTITMSGAWFAADATVTIGGSEAVVTERRGAGAAVSQIEVVSPPGTTGPADIVLVNPGIGRTRFGGLVPQTVASPTHPFLIGVFANIVALFVGYVASLFYAKPSDPELEGVTWWTRARNGEADQKA